MLVLRLFWQWTIMFDIVFVHIVHGQTAMLSGTNFASGSGFCFGDQQLKEGPPFISCAHSGFTGTVDSLTIAWTFDGNSSFPRGDAVNSMFAGRIDAVNMEPVEGRLNILNVTNLGVSSVACRIIATDDSGNLLGQTPLSATADISVVNNVPAPGVTQDTVSDNGIDIVLMRPNGLCEGLSDNPISYVIEVFSDTVLITTKNVTSTRATTVSGLSSNTSYQVDVRALINVVSQSSPATFNFTTLKEMSSSPPTSSTTASPSPSPSSFSEPDLLPVYIAVPIVAVIILVILVVIILSVFIVWWKKRNHGVKDNNDMRMSRMRSSEEKANLTEDTYASPGTEKPQPEPTDGVYSYAATETKIGAQMKEREQQKKQPPPQGDFYEEPNAAKNVQHKTGTITGETYAQPDKPKRGTKKKDKQQPVSHKEAPAGELYAMPDKKKDVSHTSGPVTGDEYAVASKPKTEGGYSAHGPQ